MLQSTCTWTFSHEAYSKTLSLLSTSESAVFFSSRLEPGVWSVWACPWVGQESIPQSLGHVQQFPNPTVEPSFIYRLMLCEALSCDQEKLVKQVKGGKVKTEWVKKRRRKELETVKWETWKCCCHIVLTEIRMEVSISSLGDLTMLDGCVTYSAG